MKKILLALAATVALPATANAALILNGSFENGTAPGSYLTLANGSTAITGWTVGGDGVDYIGSYWAASDGSRSVDLSGNAAGSLSQSFATVAGRTYNVSFDLGGNGDGPPSIKTVNVSATGASGGSFTTGSTQPPGMNYTPYTYSFVAGGSSTTLSFAAGDAGAFGPALDNVSVTAIPEPATWGMMMMGFGAVGGAMRRRRRAAFSIA